MKRPKGEPPRNMAASVKARLMGVARERKEDFNFLRRRGGLVRLRRERLDWHRRWFPERHRQRRRPGPPGRRTPTWCPDNAGGRWDHRAVEHHVRRLRVDVPYGVLRV